MQAALVQRAIARRSCLKNLVSLESLSQRVVLQNLDFFRDKKHLFEYLPCKILEPLLNACVGTDEEDEWRELLEQGHIQKQAILIENHQSVPVVCGYIQEKFKSLRALCLSCEEYNDNVEELSLNAIAICKLVKSLPQLRRLQLRKLPVTNQVVKAIADTCTELRSLGFDNCFMRSVSPGRMCHLFDRCREIVKFTYFGDNNMFVVQQALLSLKNLQVLTCYRRLEILAGLAGLKPKLKLRFLDLDDLDETNFSTSSLVEMLPNVHVLHLRKLVDIAPFLNLEHVTELFVQGMPYKLLVQTNAANLTKLHLLDCHDVDLSMIGHLCVNLETLFMDIAEVNTKCSYKLGPEHFAKLTSVGLCALFFQSDVELPEVSGVMYRMLSSPKLKYFRANFPPRISQALLRTLITEAQREGVVFSEMQDFCIKIWGEFSSELAIQLICAMPKLKTLKLYSISDEVARQIYAFLQTNFPEIHFYSTQHLVELIHNLII